MANPNEVKAAIDDLGSGQPVKTDDQFNKPTSIQKHEDCYTRILDAYTDNLERTLKRKLRYKRLVFWFSYLLLILVCIFIAIILTKNYRDLTQAVTVIIPAIVSFLTVFIVIPKVITEYLFNADEEKYMSEIIKNIQSYDKK